MKVFSLVALIASTSAIKLDVVPVDRWTAHFRADIIACPAVVDPNTGRAVATVVAVTAVIGSTWCPQVAVPETADRHTPVGAIVVVTREIAQLHAGAGGIGKCLQ